MANVLVLGGGGREHALAWKLRQSPEVKKVYISPGNAGTEMLGENVSLNGFEEIGDFTKDKNIDLTVVGPEKPLVDGIVDYFYNSGLVSMGHFIFGPRKDAAMLEGSKAFAKKIMKENGVPTADFEVFDNKEKAMDYIFENEAPLVVKADGLAAGKGSIVCKNTKEAHNGVEYLMGEEFNKKYDGAGRRIVIEEFLEGEEASIHALTDGEIVKMLAPSQDHKALHDGDKGPNTGGMGAYAPAPVVTEEVIEKVYSKILKPIIDGMKSKGIPYTGLIYPGLMIKDEEPKVVEINARFGDPETQVVLPLLRDDLYKLMMATIDGSLDKYCIENKDLAACCVVMASGGYPGSYEKGKTIHGLDKLPEDTLVFHAGTKREGNNIVTNGGRVLGVTGFGSSIEQAISNAYEGVDVINWDKEYHRKDIGQKALKHL